MISLFEPSFDHEKNGEENIRWEPSVEIDQMIRESRKDGQQTNTNKKVTENLENNEKNSERSSEFKFNFLEPNNFVCTTAVKAYGRKMDVVRALAVLPWMESKGVIADTYLLSSLLFVCAKTKRVAEAEDIFWQQLPARNLTYSVATTNSLMYMYAKLNRPDDALKVYELAKGAYVLNYKLMFYVLFFFHFPFLFSFQCFFCSL